MSIRDLLARFDAAWDAAVWSKFSDLEDMIHPVSKSLDHGPRERLLWLARSGLLPDESRLILSDSYGLEQKNMFFNISQQALLLDNLMEAFGLFRLWNPKPEPEHLREWTAETLRNREKAYTFYTCVYMVYEIPQLNLSIRLVPKYLPDEIHKPWIEYLEANPGALRRFETRARQEGRKIPL